MRFPLTVSQVIRNLYEPTQEEIEEYPDIPQRLLKAEVLTWDDDMVPTLKSLAMDAVVQIFTTEEYLSEMLQQDVNEFMEKLPTNLDIKYTVDVIEDDTYWERCCRARWTEENFIPTTDEMFWKRMYLRRHLEEYIENIVPEEYDENEAIELAELVADYVDEINITQLLIVKLPPLPEFDESEITDECIIPEEFIPYDHISLNSILCCLTNITKFRIVFGVKNLASSYDERLFRFSVADCQALCEGLFTLEHLKVICVNKSRLDDTTCVTFMQYIDKMDNIEEIDFSHCHIGDKGACALAQCLLLHPNLKIVRVANNKFGEEGFQAIAYCLQSKPKAILNILDLRLNFLTSVSANYLASAITRCMEKPKEINVSGCNISGRGAVVMAGMLKLNRGLQKLDISVNDFSGEAEANLIEAMSVNKVLLEVDMRLSGMSEKAQETIKGFLERNKGFVGTYMEPPQPPPPLYKNDPEYLIWEYNPTNPQRIGNFYPPRIPEN